MAWVRTAVSMITFGFTIYKFFQFEVQGRPPIEQSMLGPRGFALIMIAIGVLALLVSTIQHRWSLRALRVEYRRSRTALGCDARRRSVCGAGAHRVGFGDPAVVRERLSYDRGPDPQVLTAMPVAKSAACRACAFAGAGLGLLWCVLTVSAFAQSGAPATQPTPEAGVPIIYRGQEIVRIYRGVGGIGPAERARMASERLNQFVRDPSFDPTRVTVSAQRDLQRAGVRRPRPRRHYRRGCPGCRAAARGIRSAGAGSAGRGRDQYARGVQRLVHRHRPGVGCARDRDLGGPAVAARAHLPPGPVTCQDGVPGG